MEVLGAGLKRMMLGDACVDACNRSAPQTYLRNSEKLLAELFIPLADAETQTLLEPHHMCSVQISSSFALLFV